VMGDVEIGKRVMIGPHEVVMPKTRIPDVEKTYIESNN